jgi:hypothetical protein
VPEADAELNSSDSRSAVRPIRLVDGASHQFRYGEASSELLAVQKGVLAVGERYLGLPTHVM